MQKIVSNLWFDTQAQEAAEFYVSVFKDAKLGAITHYPKAAEEVSGKRAGSVMTVSFELAGQEFVALNGGPLFKFNEAVSFIINCADQDEIDYYWNKLSAIPEAEQCGWLKDKFGVSWQVVPAGMDDFFKNEDSSAVEKVMAAFLKMKKIDIEGLKQAAR